MASNENLGRERLFDCTGLVVVITGGGTGIGLVMARALARNGAIVYILGRRLAKLQEAASSAAGLTPGRLIPLEADVTSKSSLEAVTAHIAAETGYVNLVIANAGIMGRTDEELMPRTEDDERGPLTLQEAQKHLWDTPTEDILKVYEVNIVGAFRTAVAFLDLLDKGNAAKNVRQTSQILVISSIGGFHRNFMRAGLSYTTSKAAVTHLVKSLASFLIRWKIRVNGLAPGVFPSEIIGSYFGDKDLTIEGALPPVIPLRRAGRDEEMGGTVLYYASEAGAYCSGSIHLIDGGSLGNLPGTTY